MQAVGPTPQSVRQQLERVLASARFARNERQSRFLRYVVEGHLEGRDAELKESLIGVEVLGSRDYDPRQDSLVRTEAGRLRARLAEYYAGEGSKDPLIIELPKGSYVPAIRHSEAEVRAPVPLAATQPGTRHWLMMALGVLAIAVAGAIWWGSRHSAPITIAVLPLENLGNVADNDSFADGLTDELIRNLSIIEGLEVRSRTSSFTFKAKTRNVAEAGKQLHVDYLLEGSVFRAGRQLRINCQLVRVRDDATLWSNRFDRSLTDVFAIQDQISLGIVNGLRLKLGSGRRRYETSIEAYELYLHVSPSRPSRGMRWYEQAIAKDPSFAPAWAGLATAYAKRSTLEYPLDPEVLPKMREAAQKAVALDPLLAEAQDAMALSCARDANWRQAEHHFRRALELNPNRAETRDDFAHWFLWVLGRNQEALEQIRLARKADPLNDYIQASLGAMLLIDGRFDEGAGICQAIPYEMSGQICFVRARVLQGRISEAIEKLAPEGVWPQSRWHLGYLGYAYARCGQRDQAEKLAAASIDAITQAVVFAGLGDKDRTFEALDRVNAQHGPQWVGIFLNDPEFVFLRSDPRFERFRRRILKL